MKLKKMLVVFLSIMVLSTFVVGCGSSQSSTDGQDGTNVASGEPEYVWKFAHEEYEGDAQQLYAAKFKEIIEEKSNGRIQIEVYPVGQLGDATQQCELLQNGGIEIACVSPGNTGTIVPENQLFSLHFLFPENMDDVQKIFTTSEALNKDLSALYAEKNLKVMSYWPEGFMSWTSNKPLDTPAGFKGMKFRTMPSPMIVAAYEAYGANPTPVPYPEVYSGLQLNMIEGQENPLFCVSTMKFYEVQKYLTISHHDLYVTTTCVNPHFYDSLPDDVRQMLDETLAELEDWCFDIGPELNTTALEEIKANAGEELQIVELTPEQRDAYRKASVTAYDTYKEMVGDKGAAILDKLMQEVAAVEK